MSEGKTTEQDIREALNKAVESSDYLGSYGKDVEGNPRGFIQVHGPALAAYLMSCSADRQEKLQQEQSKLLDQMKTEAEKTGTTTRWLVLASVGIAVLALLVSWYSARSSLSWQKDQIPLLRKIADHTAPATQPADE